MINTNSPVAWRIPVLTAAPFPLLYGCVATIAPAPRAVAAVASRDPSSTTMISCHRAAASSPATTPAITSASLYAGMTIETVAGSAKGLLSLPASFAGEDRGRRLHRLILQLDAANAVQQILQQFAIGGNHIREQPDEDDLEADNHQHCHHHQRSKMLVRVALKEVVHEPQEPRDSDTKDREPDIRKHLERFVHRIDAYDRRRRSLDVREQRIEQARLARPRVGLHRHVRNRHALLAGLNDRLERIGELRHDRHFQRGLARIRAETAGRVRDARIRHLPDDPAPELLKLSLSP